MSIISLDTSKSFIMTLTVVVETVLNSRQRQAGNV